MHRQLRRSSAVLPVCCVVLLALGGCGGVPPGGLTAARPAATVARATDPAGQPAPVEDAVAQVADDEPATTGPTGPTPTGPTSPTGPTAPQPGPPPATATAATSARGVVARTTGTGPTTPPGARTGAPTTPPPATTRTTASRATTTTVPTLGPATESAVEAEVVRLVNVEREEVGCADVLVDGTLVQVARAHSKEMTAPDGFKHNSPDGRTPFQRMTAAGYDYLYAAENIAAGQPTAAAVVAAWMSSDGHRSNIMDCRFTQIGVGMVQQPGSAFGTYWTQDFGTPLPVTK